MIDGDVPETATATAAESVRLAELAASLSLATDIGLGVALEHGERSALLTVALAEAAGLDENEARDAFYVALLKTVGCTGDDDFGIRVLGEDSGRWIAHMAGGSPAEFLGAIIANVGRDDAFPRRVGKLLRALGKGPGMPSRAHCEVGRLLAERLGLSARVATAMTQVFEGWDGKGRPERLKGEAIERVVRVVQLASDAQAAHRLLGADGTVALVKRRAGGGYDPKLADVLCRHAPRLLAALDVPSVHDALVAAEPGAPVRVAGGRAGRRDRDGRPVRRHEVALHARPLGGRRRAGRTGRRAAGARRREGGPARRAPARHRAGGRRAGHLGQTRTADRGRARARAHAQLLHRARAVAAGFAGSGGGAGRAGA